MSFRFPTVADYAEAYRTGASDPVHVAERALTAARTLDRMDPPMRTFLALDEGDVRRQAEAAAKRRQKGAPVPCPDHPGRREEKSSAVRGGAAASNSAPVLSAR